VKNIVDREKLAFLNEMGVLWGLTRTRARSKYGSRVYDLKPFYRGAKVTVIGAISLNKVVGLMTVKGSMDSQVFAVFVEHCDGAKLMERCSRCYG
jgi:hypothetical protein